MPCYHPTNAWRSKEVNPSGKRGLVFQRERGIEAAPITIPCGGCLGCRLDRARQWTLRLTHESKFHEQKAFLTLTYSDENLPPGATLVKKHHQDFLKRLRKKHGGKLRYFLCGEYGERTNRPHYHAIIFGTDFADRVPHSTGSQGDPIYKSKILDEVWGLGHCYIGNVTPESCGYVARYIMKKVTGEQAEEHYQYVDVKTGEIFHRQPEYINMSTRPGIGLDYYEKFKTDVFPSDYSILKGKKMPVPKYYDRKLEQENPQLIEKIKRKRIARAKRNKADNTPDRLAAKKAVKQAQFTKLKRDFE